MSGASHLSWGADPLAQGQAVAPGLTPSFAPEPAGLTFGSYVPTPGTPLKSQPSDFHPFPRMQGAPKCHSCGHCCSVFQRCLGIGNPAPPLLSVAFPPLDPPALTLRCPQAPAREMVLPPPIYTQPKGVGPPALEKSCEEELFLDKW